MSRSRPRGDRTAAALARVLLRLYPHGFRRDAGADLIRDHAARGLERRQAGAAVWASWLLRAALVLVATAIAEWRDELGGRMPSAADARATLRALLGAPAFALTAIATLAIAIGANTAAFALVNGVLLRPLPYAEPEQLVDVWSSWTDAPRTWVSAEEYALYARQASSLAGAAAYFSTRVNLNGPGDPVRLSVAGFTPELLPLLGVEPVVGRAFSAAEARDGERVVLISHRLWSERFGNDPSAVGRTLDTEGNRQRVLGVLPADFRLPHEMGTEQPADIFFPYWVDVEAQVEIPWAGGNHGLYVVGRLAPGATQESAQAELNGLIDRVAGADTYPEHWHFSVRVHRLSDDVLGDSRSALRLLWGAALFVLAIAGANVANLLLARADQKQVEMGVRAALGAGRGTLFRLLLAETAVLAAVATTLGLGAAIVIVRLFVARNPWTIPRLETVAIDGAAMGYGLLVAALLAGAAGLAPAWRASRSALTSGPENTRGATRRSHSTRRVLVAAQTAAAVLLLIGCALMVRTVISLGRIDPGFRAAGVHATTISLPTAAYPAAAEVTATLDDLLRRVRGLPDVERAALVRVLPLAGSMGTTGAWPVDGIEREEGTDQVEYQVVSEDYFEALGIRLLAGRPFAAEDRAAADAVVVSRTMARQFWGGSDPLGREVRFMGEVATVIGVVDEVAHEGLLAARRPQAYRLHRQLPAELIGHARTSSLLVRSDRAPADLAAALRREIAAVLPGMPFQGLRSLAAIQADTYAEQRFVAAALGGAGAVAALLAAVGLYGVLAYAVSLRRREIGIRMALGADRRRVVAGVVGGGLLLIASGIAAGLGLAFLLSGALAGSVYGVRPTDPATFVQVAIGFGLLGLLASWLPARRASRIAPARVLE